MNFSKENLIDNLSLKKIIFRLITAWLFLGSIYMFIDRDYNYLEYNQNTSIFLSLFFVIIIFGVITVVSTFLHKFNIDSKAMFIITLLFLLLMIINSYGIDAQHYELLAMSLVLIIISILAYNDNKELFKEKEIKKLTVIIIASISALFSFILAFLVLLYRYRSFASPNFDFGIFVNSFYNMSKTGRPIIACERDVIQSHFCVHLSPIFYVVLPLYYIFPYAETIQFFQAMMVALGIIPLLLILFEKKVSNGLIIFISVIYAFFPIFASSNYYDFHENAFLTFILLFIFYFIEKKKMIPYYIFIALLLMVKEDAAFYGLVIGLFLILNKKDYIKGLITCFVSLLYFYIAVSYLNNFGSGAMTNRFSNLIYDSNSGIFGMIKTFINNPGYTIRQIFLTNEYNGNKFLYMLVLLLPLGFIPIIIKKPSYLILLIPCLLNLLTLYSYQYSFYFQYSYAIIAFLFYLTILNITEIKEDVRNISLIIASSTTYIFYFAFTISFLTGFIELYRSNKAQRIDYANAIKLVPKDATASVSTFILPHMANRKVIYEEYYHRGKFDTEYVVIDATETDFNKVVIFYETNGYTSIYKTENVIVLKQNTLE